MSDEPGGVKVFPLDPACEQYHRPTIAKGHLIELHRQLQQKQLDLDLAADILDRRNERIRDIEAKASVLAKEVREMVNILEAEGNSLDRVLAEKWHLILDPVEETLTENEPRGVLKP